MHDQVMKSASPKAGEDINMNSPLMDFDQVCSKQIMNVFCHKFTLSCIGCQPKTLEYNGCLITPSSRAHVFYNHNQTLFDGKCIMPVITFHSLYIIRQALVNTTMQEQSRSNNNADIPAAEHEVMGPHFIQHSYLTSLNLVVNVEFNLLICQLCKEAISTPTTCSHIVNKHPELLSLFSMEWFQMAVTELGLTDSLPTGITGPKAIVHGLAICDALACQHCPTVMSKYNNIRQHHTQNHHNQPVPSSWRSCKAQRMKAEGAGSQRTFWEVIVPRTTGSDPITEQLMNSLKKQLNNVQVPTDHRLITPWLRMTRWHEYVAGSGFTIDWLRQSIMLPQRDEIDCKDIHGIMERYFKQALELIDTTDELVLQRINSPDPLKR